MTEKGSMPTEEMASRVHGAILGLAEKMNKGGAPLLVIAGELVKLGAKMAIHEQGMVAAEQNVRKLLDRYFASITPELEAQIRRKVPIKGDTAQP